VDTVLVLNADLGPLHRVSLRHAIRMLCRQVVEIHESEDHIPRFGVWPKPTIVRLISYIVPKWRYTDGPAWSRPGVLARDSRKCGYCGGHATTVDHITPRSQGGRNDWQHRLGPVRRGRAAPGKARHTHWNWPAGFHSVPPPAPIPESSNRQDSGLWSR
jgi:hypothetical protein